MGERPNTEEVSRFLLNGIKNNSDELASTAANAFGISRQAVYARIRRFVADGLVVVEGGPGRSRRLSLVKTRLAQSLHAIDSRAEESAIWSSRIRPVLGELNLPDNVMRVCAHGFTEMVNNAIDHSEGKVMTALVDHTALDVTLTVDDDGIGIFRKVKNALQLEEERHSILELTKGKFSTDPSRHSGEGIFFTSRMFDAFSIHSRGLYFQHDSADDDWLIEKEKSDTPHGTRVTMQISKRSTTTPKEVFDRFCSGEDPTFSKTHVPVTLIQYGEENLISRSQARRLLARFERFQEILLDFHEVASIGQAFADEIFRVFRLQNPTIKVFGLRATEEVRRMIERAEIAYRLQQQTQPNDD